MFRARPLGILVLGTACAVALPAVTAPAQQSMMFMDDGEGPGFMRFGGPQIHTLRKPDFERSDVPIFRDTLRLSEDQQAVVEDLLAAYIEAYQALVAEHFPRQAGPPGVAMHGGDGENAFALEGMIGTEMLPGPGELEDMGIDVEEGAAMVVAVGGNMTMDPQMMAEGGTMDIDIEAGGEPGTGAPSANVMISVAGPDGEELPEEVRKQLEEKAAELAEKLKEQMEKNIAEGRDPLDGAIPVADRIDEHRRRFEELEKRAEALKAAGAGLKQEFIDDVQERLADEQLARWPILDRALTRKKTLPNGRLDGERVDLIATLDSMELNDPARTAIREEADAYALVMHDALIQRNRFLDHADKRVNTALEAGDTTKALSIVDHGTRLRVAVRDANHWFGEAIAERLPAPDAAAFRAEVNRLAHPRVFRPTRGQKAFDAARRMSEELDTETRQAIDELEVAYREELAGTNERLVATIRKNQPGETRRAIEMMTSVKAGDPLMIGHDETDPIREAYAKRRELDARYVKLLRGMLTPEQAERLPKPPKRRTSPFIIERGTMEPF